MELSRIVAQEYDTFFRSVVHGRQHGIERRVFVPAAEVSRSDAAACAVVGRERRERVEPLRTAHAAAQTDSVQDGSVEPVTPCDGICNVAVVTVGRGAEFRDDDGQQQTCSPPFDEREEALAVIAEQGEYHRARTGRCKIYSDQINHGIVRIRFARRSFRAGAGC